MAENNPDTADTPADTPAVTPRVDPALDAWNTALTPRASLWRDADFMKFWAGQSISVFGSAITMLALPLTAVTLLQASPAQMGILNAAETLPFLLIGLFAGVYIDRNLRRPILIGADLARALLLGTIPLAMLLGALRIELLILVAFLAGTAQVYFDVAYQSFLPSLVGRERLIEGNSKLEISSSAAQFAGPGLAGWLIQALSAPIAIAFDACSFLVSAASLTLIGTKEARPAPAGERPGLWRAIGEGLGVIFRNRLLWSIAGCTATFNLFFGALNAVYMLYLSRELGILPQLMGIIFAAPAPGALAGALLAGHITKRVGLGPTIAGASVVAGVASLLIPLARGPLPLVAGLLMLVGFVVGMANVVYNVNQVSLRQAITPGRLLGRMNASMRFLVWGTLPVGSLIGGAIGQLVGVYQALLFGACGQLLACLWILFSPVRSLREQPAPAQE